MKVSAEVAKELLGLYKKGEVDHGFKLIDRGEWIDDGKYSHKEMIFQHIESGKFYRLFDSRSGSYHSDYYYVSEDWKDDVELTEVRPVEKTIVVYEAVTGEQ